ncbi:MoaD/ThiS family protein [Robertkochia marina]|uniref:Molybdopterin synthase sulfur carrier subunit n=1 Tax=Robertkochia marina TaxID=1227945 RepID=A0A4S3M607_9FLAO|nr:MoaD/ThiS family protein [Robertkochia marina]THD69821.1 MoaD/ThiS family protein [Robertkochia marina]TRZ46834.1 MoaD/ThiS family protein [Robertkochia marina]
MKDILLFGVTREIVGGATVRISEEEFPKDVASLKAMLMEKYPPLKEIISLRIAVNNEFAKDELTIGSEDEIALIPPVSGG